MAALADLESRFPVDEWRVGGVCLWPLLRIRWLYGEWARHYNAPAAAPSTVANIGAHVKGILSGARAAARTRRDDPRGDDAGMGRRDIVFLSDGLSFARLGEHWVERFCDPLIAAASGRGLTAYFGRHCTAITSRA